MKGKILIAFGLGACMGSLFVYLYSKEKYERKLEEEISALRAHYIKKKEKMDAEQEVKRSTVRTSIDGMYKHNRARVYNPKEDTMEPDIESDDDIPPAVVESRMGPRDDSDPYLISMDDFYNDNGHYEKETWTYFDKDNTICNQEDEMIIEVSEWIGYDNIGILKGISTDHRHRVIYIRVEKHDTDIELIYNSGSYLEQVAGEPYEPTEGYDSEGLA